MDFNKQYLQSELPSDVFNAGNGDVKNFNGQQVKVTVNGNGTRSLAPTGGAGGSGSDPIALAQKMRDFTVQSNQPAIASLQQNKTDLQGKYQDLLKSITDSEQPALNSTILATNNELGKRGITGDSSLGQQQIAQAQVPITTQFGQLQAQTGLAQQQDMNSLAAQIANLQSGNPDNAVNNATSFGNAQTQAQAAIQQALIQQQTQQQANAIQDAYNKGQLSLEQAKNAIELATLQNVTIPSAKAGITASLAGAGASSASAALNNFQLGQLKSSGSNGVSTSAPSYFTPLR
jgi:hypothetical protein